VRILKTKKDMESKEKIYDDQIAPLMEQIIEICKKEEIPMFADFQYNDTDFCTTCIYPEIEGRNVVTKLFNVLSKCRTESGLNVDQFFFHILKNYDNESSIVMKMMGKDPV